MAKPAILQNKVARLVGLALMVGAGVFVLVYEPEPPTLPPPPNDRPAKLLEVESAARTAARSYSGVVEPTEQVDLSFRVSGPLVQLPISRGQLVEPGALIAQVDPRDFQTSLDEISASLDEAKAKLAAMRAGARSEVILRLENQLSAARADYGNAKVELDRMAGLLKENVISESEYDQAKLRHDTAQQAMKSAEQELEQGKKGARQEDVDAQEATIRGIQAQEQDARNQLADTSIKAPFAGRIAKQFVENFQEVRAGAPIVSLQDVSRTKVVADVPESMVAILTRDIVEKLTVTFEAVPDRVFDVEFREMETEADRRTQTYRVSVQMPAPDDVNLLPGMPAMLQIHIRVDRDDVASGFPVPATSVFADEAGQSRVWKVAEDRTVTSVPVEVGKMSGALILVRKGLAEGDTIVTAGANSIRPGMKVFPFVVQSEK